MDSRELDQRKTLQTHTVVKSTDENDEFEKQRTAAIAEVAKTKEVSKPLSLVSFSVVNFRDQCFCHAGKICCFIDCTSCTSDLIWPQFKNICSLSAFTSTLIAFDSCVTLQIKSHNYVAICRVLFLLLYFSLCPTLQLY